MTDHDTKRRFGNVRRLRSGRYQARWTDPAGEVHTGPATYATRAEAELWLAGERLLKADRRAEEVATFEDSLRALIREAVAAGVADALSQIGGGR